MSPVDKNDFIALRRRLIVLSIIFIATLITLVAVASFFFSKEIHLVSRWLLDHFGFTALGIVVYLGDVFLSPIPPDVILIVIANSRLESQWPFYVGVLSLFSVTSAYTSWLIGFALSKKKWIPQYLRDLASQQSHYVKKYGFWAVAFGAMTPFPFSITCWSAGFLHMNLKTFTLGAVTRIPRFYFYYWIIKSAQWSAEHVPL